MEPGYLGTRKVRSEMWHYTQQTCDTWVRGMSFLGHLRFALKAIRGLKNRGVRGGFDQNGGSENKILNETII